MEVSISTFSESSKISFGLVWEGNFVTEISLCVSLISSQYNHVVDLTRPSFYINDYVVSHKLYNKRLTQNWHGLEESDCLIKTKHCDDPNGC